MRKGTTLPNDTLRITKNAGYLTRKITRGDINKNMLVFILEEQEAYNARGGQHGLLSDSEYKAIGWQKGLLKQLKNNKIEIVDIFHDKDRNFRVKELRGCNCNSHGERLPSWFYTVLTPSTGRFLCQKGLKCPECWKAFNRFQRLMFTHVAMMGVATLNDRPVEEATIALHPSQLRIMWSKNKYKIVALRTRAKKKLEKKKPIKRKE